MADIRPGARRLADPRREKFCNLHATGKYTLGEAYVKAGFAANGAKQSAHRLLNKEEIQQRVEFLRIAIAAGVEQEVEALSQEIAAALPAPEIEQAPEVVPIADKLARPARVAIKDKAQRIINYDQRLRDLYERRAKLYDLIQARANDPEHADVTGANTGLLAVTYKKLGKTLIKEATFDAALAREILSIEREMRELEKQSSIEMGHWTEKFDATIREKRIEDMSAEELRALVGEQAPTGEQRIQ